MLLKKVQTAFKKLTHLQAKSLLLYTIIFLLPVNLGYHFIFKWTYVHGLLTDYLIPTVYLQDILIFILLCMDLSFLRTVFKKINAPIIWFLYALALSIFISVLPQASVSMYLRTFLYALFSLYLRHNVRFEFVSPLLFKVFTATVFFLSLLGIMQWTNQGAIFNNYLFFGEQPYNFSTPGINKEYFFGSTHVAAYGTFRHPNVFGGFLSIVLIWIYSLRSKGKFYLFTFLLGCIALLFTLSKTAWLAFFVGIGAYYLFRRGKFVLLHTLMVFVLAVGLLLPSITAILSLKNVSITTRSDLLTASYEMLLARPTFGYGYNSSTTVIQDFLRGGHSFKFAQPVHNIFVLILVEAGVVGLLAFLLLLFSALYRAKNSFLLIYISLLQILILGSFDHYIITMHQTHILFWLLIGLV